MTNMQQIPASVLVIWITGCWQSGPFVRSVLRLVDEAPQET